MWPSEKDISNAKRIHVVEAFHCVCTKPCRYSRRWFSNDPKRQNLYYAAGFARIAIESGKRLKVQVLQGWINEQGLDWTTQADLLPDLRALSARLTDRSPLQIDGVLPQLTHLELTRFEPTTFPDGFSHPTLISLSISITQTFIGTYLVEWDPLRAWDLPKLLYLNIEGDFNDNFIETHLHTLLQSAGGSLRGVAIKQTIMPSISPNGFAFPVEIWEWCPNLSCVGGAAQSLQRMTPPPPLLGIKSVLILRLFGRNKVPNQERECPVRETSQVVAAFSSWNVDHFNIGTTWSVWLHWFLEKPLEYRAEWANFLVQFGLFGRRHGPPLRDIDGVAFDDERAAFARQTVQVEVVMLSERLETTSWTKFAFKR